MMILSNDNILMEEISLREKRGVMRAILKTIKMISAERLLLQLNAQRRRERQGFIFIGWLSQKKERKESRKKIYYAAVWCSFHLINLSLLLCRCLCSFTWRLKTMTPCSSWLSRFTSLASVSWRTSFFEGET